MREPLRCLCGRWMSKVPWFDGIAIRHFRMCSHCLRATNNSGEATDA